MRSVLKYILVGFAAVLTGCAATGPKFSEVGASLPPLAAGQARVYVYRDSIIGAALKPDVRIDAQVIAPMQPNSFIFADVPAGRHIASASTEADANLEFSVQEGDTAYIRMTIGIGLVVGRPTLTLQPAAVATQALPALAYGGGKPLIAGGSGSRPPASAGTPSPTAPRSSASRQQGVSIDDLRGLMPASR